MVGVANSGFSSVQPSGSRVSSVCTIGTGDCQASLTSARNLAQKAQSAASNATSWRVASSAAPTRRVGGVDAASGEPGAEAAAIEVASPAAGGVAPRVASASAGNFTPVPPSPQYPSGFFTR